MRRRRMRWGELLSWLSFLATITALALVGFAVMGLGWLVGWLIGGETAEAIGLCVGVAVVMAGWLYFAFSEPLEERDGDGSV